MEELKEKPKYEWQKITWLSNLFTPLNRKFHVSVYHDKSLFIFGGDANPQLRPQGSEKTLNELYQLKLNQRQFNWTKITSFKATFFPLIISQLSVIGYEKNLIFYGGVNGKSVLNTVFSFDLGSQHTFLSNHSNNRNNISLQKKMSNGINTHTKGLFNKEDIDIQRACILENLMERTKKVL